MIERDFLVAGYYIYWTQFQVQIQAFVAKETQTVSSISLVMLVAVAYLLACHFLLHQSHCHLFAYSIEALLDWEGHNNLSIVVHVSLLFTYISTYLKRVKKI